MMKTWSFSILVALGLAAVPAFADSPKAPGKAAPAAAKGSFNLVCNPSCDDVVINGRSFGPSPVVRGELPAGTYEVTLKRKAQADVRKQIVVTAGQTSPFNFALPVQTAPTASPEMAARLASRMKVPDGWISIQCDPACDDVVVDGKRSLGRNTANVALPPGEHEVTGKRKGSADKTMKVRVVEGQTTAVRLNFVASTSAVSASADPAAMRKSLEAKITSNTATIDDVKQLRGICLQQGDKACVAKMDTRLNPPRSR